MHRTAIGFAVAIALAGCAGNGDGLDENGQPIGAEPPAEPPPLTATFESIQQNVFTPVCTTCHTGATAPVGLRLDADASYAMLVNAPSAEVPGLSRVLPGDPDNSYLIRKLEGNGAVGGRMPLNQPPLPQATIEVIRQWIAAGAQQATAIAPSKPAMLTAVAPAADAILDAPPREILVTANAGLDVNLLNSGSVVLERSGKDGSFDEGNEVTLAPLHLQIRSFEPTVIAITLPASQWVTDSYRLTISGGEPAAVADMGGRIIDGNADGTAGGDFILYFDLLSHDAGVSL